jgi:hypothetical protein
MKLCAEIRCRVPRLLLKALAMGDLSFTSVRIMSRSDTSSRQPMPRPAGEAGASLPKGSPSERFYRAKD